MNKTRRFLAVSLTLLLIALPLVALWQRQNIYDYWRLKNYDPPAQIATLATNTTMTDKGRRLFYLNHPELDIIDTFHQNCSDSEQSIVLGCYRQGVGIFLYNVQDNRLNGVLEVTAAHEMLHSAYDHLSGKERKRIDALTEQAFANLKDARIRATIEQYRQKDPSVVPNELHSILATEVRSLPPELSDYYARYFSDRLKIVGYSEQYEQEFTRRNAQIDAYDRQLAALKKQIEADEGSLDGQIAQIQGDRKNLEDLLSSNQREAYNQQVPTFNAKVNAYNTQVRKVQNEIQSYNQIVATRNDLAKQIRDLANAIDTRITQQQIEQ